MGFSTGAIVNKANIAMMTSRKKAKKVKYKLSVVPHPKTEYTPTRRLGEVMEKQTESVWVTRILRAAVIVAWVAVIALAFVAFTTFWNR